MEMKCDRLFPMEKIPRTRTTRPTQSIIREVLPDFAAELEVYAIRTVIIGPSFCVIAAKTNEQRGRLRRCSTREERTASPAATLEDGY